MDKPHEDLTINEILDDPEYIETKEQIEFTDDLPEITAEKLSEIILRA
ncbi:hypothetical protein AAXB25_14975 [Paenibacillus lautus]